MKRISLFVTIFLFPFFVFAQKDINTLIEQGVKLHDAADYKGAIAKFEAALKIDAKNITANYEIANTYTALQDYKKALKYVEKVFEDKEALLGEAYMLKGTILDMMGKPKESIKNYEEGIKAAPKLAQLMYFNMGVTYAKEEQFKESEIALIESIKLKPSHPGSHYVLGQINFMQHHTTKSLMAYYNFLLLEPKSERAQTTLKRVYKMLEGEKNETGGLNISLNFDKVDSSFGASDLYISMLPAVTSALKDAEKDSAKVIEKKVSTLKADTSKNPAARFAIQNENIFTYFDQAKSKGSGFFWQYYADFYGEMSKEGHSAAFSYYISNGKKDKDVTAWLSDNKDKFKAFVEWIKTYEFNTK
jgi:Tfp pilus assembly protein PilF